jgi:hypothetical protein
MSPRCPEVWPKGTKQGPKTGKKNRNRAFRAGENSLREMVFLQTPNRAVGPRIEFEIAEITGLEDQA